MASRSTPTASSETAMDRPARSLPAAQCISAGTLSSASACSTRLCSAVRSLMIVRYEATSGRPPCRRARIDAQLVEVAVADHLPELGAVGRVGERQVHIAHAGQLDVRALQPLVGRVAEVEDRVQAQRGEERGVRLGGVGEMTAAEEPPVPHPPAVHGRQAAHVAEVAHSGQLGLCRRDLRQLLRHGGSCSRLPSALLADEGALPTIRHRFVRQSVSAVAARALPRAATRRRMMFGACADLCGSVGSG